MYLSFALKVGVEQHINQPGKYFYISKSDASIKVRGQSGRSVDLEKGQGFPDKQGFEELWIESGVDQSVTVFVGDERPIDNRATLSATVNAAIEPSDTVNNPGDASCGATATLLIASNASRKEVEICVPSTEPDPIRVGNSGVTAASGTIIEPGTSKVFGCQAALYGVRTGSTNITATVLELERV